VLEAAAVRVIDPGARRLLRETRRPEGDGYGPAREIRDEGGTDDRDGGKGDDAGTHTEMVARTPLGVCGLTTRT
jgi:hypothetical protein